MGSSRKNLAVVATTLGDRGNVLNLTTFGKGFYLIHVPRMGEKEARKVAAKTKWKGGEVRILADGRESPQKEIYKRERLLHPTPPFQTPGGRVWSFEIRSETRETEAYTRRHTERKRVRLKRGSGARIG